MKNRYVDATRKWNFTSNIWTSIHFGLIFPLLETKKQDEAPTFGAIINDNNPNQKERSLLNKFSWAANRSRSILRCSLLRFKSKSFCGMKFVECVNFVCLREGNFHLLSTGLFLTGNPHFDNRMLYFSDGTRTGYSITWYGRRRMLTIFMRTYFIINNSFKLIQSYR